MSGFGELFAQYDIVGAFLVNLSLTFFSAIGALVLGTILAIMRVAPAPSTRLAGAWYVNTVRNTPLTLIVLACSLGLFGQLGVILADQTASDFIASNSFRLAVLGLAAYHAAFVCEALRSGINTVAGGQAEAARSIGLGFRQTMGLVILPQAFRGAIAPLGNTLIALAKNSTVAQAAGVVNSSSIMYTMLEFRPDLIVQIFTIVAVGWLIIVLPLGLLSTWLSNRWKVVR